MSGHIVSKAFLSGGAAFLQCSSCGDRHVSVTSPALETDYGLAVRSHALLAGAAALLVMEAIESRSAFMGGEFLVVEPTSEGEVSENTKRQSAFFLILLRHLAE